MFLFIVSKCKINDGSFKMFDYLKTKMELTKKVDLKKTFFFFFLL